MIKTQRETLVIVFHSTVMMLKRCTLRLSISRGILPLTSLVGAEFVKAWLEAVKRMSNTFFFACLIDDTLTLGSTYISLDLWYRIW